MKQIPKYMHDCEFCEFVGNMESNLTGAIMDIYWHKDVAREIPSIIVVRYGDSFFEYAKILPWMPMADELQELVLSKVENYANLIH